MAKFKGGVPGGGMGNMSNMIRQAQKMQEQMEKTKEDIGEKEVETTTGGGAVKIVMSGKKEVRSLVIQKEVVDPEDVEMLQDLITSAVNQAIRDVDTMMDSAMSKIAGGMNVPGLF